MPKFGSCNLVDRGYGGMIPGKKTFLFTPSGRDLHIESLSAGSSGFPGIVVPHIKSCRLWACLPSG